MIREGQRTPLLWILDTPLSAAKARSRCVLFTSVDAYSPLMRACEVAVKTRFLQNTDIE